MTTLSPMLEVAFGDYGGAECFFSDIDGDGRLEILTYQGPGVLGAEPFRSQSHIKPLLPESVSVSAFRINGQRMWTWGRPNPCEQPYVSHSYESCIAAADINADGRTEVVLANGGQVVVLDGGTGDEINARQMPGDCYFIVQAVSGPMRTGEAAIIVKNGEVGQGNWRYGEPVLGLNADLEPVWGPKAVPGGGHHILVLDRGEEGRREYLVGYCALGLDGRILWTVGGVDVRNLAPLEQHVDFTDVMSLPEGKTLLAMAGSDRLYLAEAWGRTLFSVPNVHCQGAALGRFREDSACQVALYNSPNGPMVLYDPSGRELWSRPTERLWPMGVPSGCEGRRFHRNRPIVALRGERSWIGFADGGWPWGMDGQGARSLEFLPPAGARRPPQAVPMSPLIRGDDIGFGYGLQARDVNGDGRIEALIYNRQFLWVYPLERSDHAR